LVSLGSPRALIILALAAPFALQTNVAYDDALVECFAHVVDGESGDGGSGECLHFNASGTGGGCCAADGDAVGCDFCGYIDEAEWKRVAHGDQIRGSLSGLNSGEAGYLKGIAFWVAGKRRQHCWRERDEGGGFSLATRWSFGAHVDHLCF